MTKHCVVGQRWTVTLPKGIRQELSIDIGDMIRFEVAGTDGVVTMRRMELVPADSQLSRMAEEGLRQIKNEQSVTLDELKAGSG